jgi:carboxypeptidase-like protein
MKKIYLLSFCFLFWFIPVIAQQSNVKLISVSFQNANAEQFATELGSKTGFDFYYDPVKFDSLRVTLNVTDKPLGTILDMAFNGKDFRYTIIGQQVFFTKGRALNSHLAAGYFNPATGPTSKQTGAIADYTDEKEKKVPEATIENKTYEIGIKTNNLKAGNATMAGYLRDIKSGEPVVGANIYDAEYKIRVSSDQFGYYSITMPRGRHSLSIKGLGMKDTWRKIILYTDGKLNIELQEAVTSLKEVKISAEKVANVRSVEMGVNKLDVKTIKRTIGRRGHHGV